MRYGLSLFALALVLTSPSAADSRANLEHQILMKTQALSSAMTETERNKIRQEIDQLRAQFEGRTNQPLQNLPQNSIGSGSTYNQQIDRTTYFYRGPVYNQTANSPFLDFSWQKGYGGTQFVEGVPVFALNHPNPYENRVPEQRVQKNPHTNPFEYTFQANNQPGSQYRPPNMGYNPYFGFGMGYDIFNYPKGGMPYQHYMGGYGMNYGGGNPLQQSDARFQVAAYDASQRFRDEIRNNPTIVAAEQIQIEVVSQTRVSNNQIQIVVQTKGGITGQNRNMQRVYLYSPEGLFQSLIDKPMTGSTQTYNMTQYRVSNEQRIRVDQYLAQRGYNQYGDPLGTQYTQDPLSNFTGSQDTDPQAARFQMILQKMPELVHLFQIKAQ